MTSGPLGHFEELRPSNAFDFWMTPSVGHLALAFLQGSFAFSGWNFLNYVTEELVDPRKWVGHRPGPRKWCGTGWERQLSPVAGLVICLTTHAAALQERLWKGSQDACSVWLWKVTAPCWASEMLRIIVLL